MCDDENINRKFQYKILSDYIQPNTFFEISNYFFFEKMQSMSDKINNSNSEVHLHNEKEVFFVPERF